MLSESDSSLPGLRRLGGDAGLAPRRRARPPTAPDPVRAGLRVVPAQLNLVMATLARPVPVPVPRCLLRQHGAGTGTPGGQARPCSQLQPAPRSPVGAQPPGLGARQARPWGRCGRPRVRFNFLKGASSTSIASWVKSGPYINSCRAHPRGRVRPLGLSTCCLRAPRGGSLPASRADAWACWRRPGNSTATL